MMDGWEVIMLAWQLDFEFTLEHEWRCCYEVNALCGMGMTYKFAMNVEVFVG